MGRRPGGKNRPKSSVSFSDTPEKRREDTQSSAFPTAERSNNDAETPLEAKKITSDAEQKTNILEAAKKIPEIFTAEQVKWIFDLYVAVLCFTYSTALKTDFAALQDELEFDDEQKNSLAIPLAHILSKHAPASWAGKADEIQLITMMGIWTVASFQRARNVAKKKLEEKRDAERTQPVQPIRREVHVPA